MPALNDDLETKDIPLSALEFKEEEGEGKGTFVGYGSIFEQTDLQNEVVEPGAFTRSLKKNNNTVPLLWQHDRNEPIGTITAEEDDRGLKVKGALALGVSRGKDAYELIKSKVLSGLSVGFRIIKDELERNTGVRRLKELDLWEVSLVTFPANLKARVVGVKADPEPRPNSKKLTSPPFQWPALSEPGDLTKLFAWLDRGWEDFLPTPPPPPPDDDAEDDGAEDCTFPAEQRELAEAALAWGQKDLGIDGEVVLKFHRPCRGNFGRPVLGFILPSKPRVIHLSGELRNDRLLGVLFHELSHTRRCLRGSLRAPDAEEGVAEGYGEVGLERYKAESKKAELEAYRAACVPVVR
jgi:hypothetical protein